MKEEPSGDICRRITVSREAGGDYGGIQIVLVWIYLPHNSKFLPLQRNIMDGLIEAGYTVSPDQRVDEGFMLKDEEGNNLAVNTRYTAFAGQEFNSINRIIMNALSKFLADEAFFAMWKDTENKEE